MNSVFLMTGYEDEIANYMDTYEKEKERAELLNNKTLFDVFSRTGKTEKGDLSGFITRKPDGKARIASPDQIQALLGDLRTIRTKSRQTVK